MLRNTDHAQIRWRIRKVFERYRHLTGTDKTIQLLRQGYKVGRTIVIICEGVHLNVSQYLDAFRKARAGDVYLQNVLERYSRLIAAKRWKEKWKQVLREEIVRLMTLIFCTYA